MILHRFDRLVDYLREKTTVARTKACLERFHRLSNLLHGVNADEPDIINVRVFLASYMIAVYPRNVFDNMGVLENKVQKSAKLLVDNFEKILYSTVSFLEIPSNITKSFPFLLFDYLRDFKAWKVPDDAKLVCRIKHSLVGLYQAIRKLPSDEPKDSRLNTELREHIRVMREKLLEKGGAHELSMFDKDHPPDTMSNTKGSAQGTELSVQMSNEQLAHELLMDPNFQLTDRGTCCESPAAQRIRESFNESFWKSIADDLSMSEPCYVRVLRILIEFRDSFIMSAPPHEAAQVAEVLDLDLIKQQIDAGVWTWASCSELIASLVELIKRVQSPKRKAETLEKWEALDKEEGPVAVCLGLEFLLKRVNELRIDTANAQIRRLAPSIYQHGIEYERGKFQDKLKAGSLTVERTTEWIKTFKGPDPISSKIFVNAMVTLVASDSPLRKEVCPETLLLDVDRICKFQDKFVHVARSVALVARLVPMLAKDKLAHIAAALATDTDMGNAVETITEVTIPIQITMEQCAEKSNAVYRLMCTRLCNAIKTGTVADFHDLVKPQVTQFVGEVNRLIQINCRIHGATYDRILKEE